jgi:hypothetical protein
MRERSEIIMDVCLALSEGDQGRGRGLITKEYPFDPLALPREVPVRVRSPDLPKLEASEETKTFWTENQAMKMRVFARDGFINRFTGELLIFPATLRLLSKEFPKELPYQQAWRLGAVHLAYYDLYACANKLVPLSPGGKGEEANLITTTMPYVLARSDSTVEEVGWRLTREGYVDEWDGMSSWYVEYVKEHPELRNENYFNMWFNAAKQVLEL